MTSALDGYSYSNTRNGSLMGFAKLAFVVRRPSSVIRLGSAPTSPEDSAVQAAEEGVVRAVYHFLHAYIEGWHGSMPTQRSAAR